MKENSRDSSIKTVSFLINPWKLAKVRRFLADFAAVSSFPAGFRNNSAFSRDFLAFGTNFR